jgi:glycosyltransferase involved in cell wall biosynthesis
MDVTSSACWAGPVVGIIRAETEFALWAIAHTNATCVVFDPARQRFRRVKDEWLQRLLDGRAALDTWDLPSVDPERPRKTDKIPAPLRTAFHWLKIRRRLLSVLEQIRLRDGAKAQWLQSIQPWLMSSKYRRRMFISAGVRRDIPSFGTALGDEVKISKDAIFVCAGSSWANMNSAELIRLKEVSGCKIVTYCYDIIPLQFPEWYKSHDVDSFRKHYHKAFPLSDLVVFSAEQIECDARAYCQRHSLRINQTAVVPLGSDFAVKTASSEPLPSGLTSGRFILFVSTIEPRKGHDLLYRVWLRLVESGVVDKSYKLVFVGRWGWKIEKLKAALLEDPRVKDRIMIMSDVSDRVLDVLYRECSFCVYPSIYEGFGLPVVEALSHGKALIASNGGALKEVVGRFSPTLEPTDVDGWYNKLAEWITDPTERRRYEERIKQDFAPRSWSAAASAFFNRVLATNSWSPSR